MLRTSKDPVCIHDNAPCCNNQSHFRQPLVVYSAKGVDACITTCIKLLVHATLIKLAIADATDPVPSSQSILVLWQAIIESIHDLRKRD